MHYLRGVGLIAVAFGLLVGAYPRAAGACKLLGPTAHEIDPAEVESDQTSPDAVGSMRVAEIRRGVGAVCRWGSCSSTSCDDIGKIAIEVTAPADDRTEGPEMGYFFEVVDGTVPEGIFIPGEEDPVRLREASATLSWIDEATDEQESFDFSLVVYAMDRGGNISDASDKLRVTHAGSRGGCSTAPHAGGGGLWLTAVLIARRRMRARRQAGLTAAASSRG